MYGKYYSVFFTVKDISSRKYSYNWTELYNIANK